MKTKPDKNKEIDEWEAKYLRALADYQNLDRRVREQVNQDKKNAAREVIIKFLPVLDDLLKAQSQIKNEGLKLIIDKFETILKSENVQKIDILTKKFNPDIMECISIVEGNKDDEVIEEVRPAYFLNGEVLRTAQVIVSKIKKEVSHV